MNHDIEILKSRLDILECRVNAPRIPRGILLEVWNTHAPTERFRRYAEGMVDEYGNIVVTDTDVCLGDCEIAAFEMFSIVPENKP